jgi:hypothetical protein
MRPQKHAAPTGFTGDKKKKAHSQSHQELAFPILTLSV